MASKRQRILEAFKTRLQTIAIADGFETDIGTKVLINETPKFGPHDSAAVVVIPGDDRIVGNFQGEYANLMLPVEIHIVGLADIDNAGVRIEQILSDVKRAIETEDRKLGNLVNHQIVRGQTRTIPRESGSEVVGSVITYDAQYRELWGDPASR